MNWTTAWTIIGSIFVACLSQIIGDKLARKREQHKYNTEQFKKLYSPTIFHLIDFITHTGYYHGHVSSNNFDIRVNLIQKIFANVDNNLEYASIEIMNLGYLKTQKIKNIGRK